MPKNNTDFQQFASQVRLDKSNFGAATSPVVALKPSELVSFNRRKPVRPATRWFKEYRLRSSMTRKFKNSQINADCGDFIIIGFFLIAAMILLYTTLDLYGMN